MENSYLHVDKSIKIRKGLDIMYVALTLSTFELNTTHDMQLNKIGYKGKVIDRYLGFVFHKFFK